MTERPDDTERTVRRSDHRPDPLDDAGETVSRDTVRRGGRTRSRMPRASGPHASAGRARGRVDGGGAGRHSGRHSSDSGGRFARLLGAKGSDPGTAPDEAPTGDRVTRARSSGHRPMPRGSGDTSSPSSRSRPTLPVITLPRVQVPTAITETGARVLHLTSDRLRPLAERTSPVWRPVVAVARWVSPIGWTVLVLGVLAWVVAARLGWPELFMMAAACLVLLGACLLLAVGHAKVEIRTDVDPTRVTVGEPATGRIEVLNRSGRGMLPLLVELPVGDSAARFTLPALGSGSSHEELFVVPTARRGVIPVGPATTVHGDPLGLVRRTRSWTDLTELFVHPRTTSLESLGAGLLRDLEGQVTPDLSMSDLAFHALREYQPGDDRRYIHWRSSAKHGRLLVRQFLDTRRSHLAVVVDTASEVYTGEDDAVELGISCAASLAVRSILDEQDTTVVVGDQQISRSTAPLTLDSFSRAETGSSDIYAAAGEAAALAPDASVAVLVTGARRPFIQVQRALGQFEVEVVKVALTVDPDEPVGVRRIGGLVLLSVRELADLRRVLFSGALA